MTQDEESSARERDGLPGDARNGTRPSMEGLTLLLNELGRGRPDALATLLPIVLEELRAIARHQLRAQDGSHTLQPTALVNEVFIKLFDPERVAWNDRHHFFALAAKAMRQLLVDHARRQQSAKRGGGRIALNLDAAGVPAREMDVDLLDLDIALEQLGELDERQARIVELRYFGGAQVDEIADALQVSVSTVEREWRAARAWLGQRLASPT